MKGMQLFDNYEEDGQLSLFSADYDDWEDDWVEPSGEESAEEAQDGNEKKTEEEVAATAADADLKAVKADATGRKRAESSAVDVYAKAVASLESLNEGPDIRVKYCASCGKLLFVKEETAGFQSECNNCGIKYFQKL